MFLLLLLAPLPAFAQEAREGGNEAVTAVPRKSPAEIRADRLDNLFARLHGRVSPEDARTIEKNIWDLWMSSDSATAEVLIRQATLAMGEREDDASLDILDRLVEAYPDFAEAWNKRATLYFNMGRYRESLNDIDKVLDLEPRHFGALSGRAMIYMSQKKYPEALEAYRDALGMNPTMESVKDAVKALEKFQQPI